MRLLYFWTRRLKRRGWPGYDLLEILKVTSSPLCLPRIQGIPSTFLVPNSASAPSPHFSVPLFLVLHLGSLVYVWAPAHRSWRMEARGQLLHGVDFQLSPGSSHQGTATY